MSSNHKAIMLAALLQALGAVCSSPAFEPITTGTLAKLSLQTAELPAGYEEYAPPAFLEQMGMHDNPDFIGNLSELETIARRGGQLPFLAVYGKDGSIRLMINGIYFRNREHLDQFLEKQRKTDKHVVTYIRPVQEGAWLLICARDPEMAYDPAECACIDQGLERFAQRIGAVREFSTLWSNMQP